MTATPINFSRSSILLHGMPKIGKTQLVSSMPGPVLFFATEYGHTYVDPKRCKVSQLDCSNGDGWTKFRATLKKLRNDGNASKLGTVAIDVTQPLYDSCMAAKCRESNIAYPSDANDHGRTWSLVQKEFSNGIGEFYETFPDAVKVFVSHTLVEERTVDMVTRTVIVPSLSKQPDRVILPRVDHIWFMGFQGADISDPTQDDIRTRGNRRCLHIDGSDSVEAGTRNPLIASKGLRVVENIPIQNPYQFVLDSLNNPA